MPKRAPATDTAVEAAISDVLAFRRRAHDAVAQAERDAQRIADLARESVRRVAERTERRILRVRAAFDATGRARIAAIDAEAAAQDGTHELTPEDFAQLARAVEALCDELTGARP